MALFWWAVLAKMVVSVGREFWAFRSLGLTFLDVIWNGKLNGDML
ncbi:MAG TPA: hypothetical protein PLP05_03805 [Sedimentisphaerales bacterium]|nr:hypothetical protein [Sedimentisphaerales bacterium]